MSLRFNPDFGPAAVSTIAELQALQPGGVVYLIDDTSNASPYYWDGTSTETANDGSVVASDQFTIGRWLLFSGFSDLGMSPDYTAEVNTAALTAAFTAGGNWQIDIPGTYSITSWPSTDENTSLTLRSGVILSDGVSTVSGPLKLDGGTWPNGRYATGGAITSGQSTVTCPAGIGLSQVDVGKLIVITDSDTSAATWGLAKAGVILSVSGNVATVSTVNAVTITDGTVVIGTDNGAALTALLGSGRPNLHLPAGIYMTSLGLVVPGGGFQLSGEGYGYGYVTEPATKGTVIMAASGSMTSLLEIGDDSSSFDENDNCTTVEKLSADGANLADYSIYTINRRSIIRDCQIWRASTYVLRIVSQNCDVYNNLIGATNLGVAVRVDAGGNDVRIFDNEIRQGISNIQVTNGATALEIRRNFIYKGFNGAIPTDSGPNIQILVATTLNFFDISDNYFNGTYGPDIQISFSANSISCRSVNIRGNRSYQIGGGGFPDNTYPFVRVDTGAHAGSAVRGLNVQGNMGSSLNASFCWKAIVELTGSGAITGATINDNSFNTCNLIYTGFTPDVSCQSNYISPGSLVSVYRSDNVGATSVADGGTVTHGLATAPSTVLCVPTTAGEMVAVTAVGTGTFTVAIRTHAGATGTTQTVYWKAFV